MKPLRSVLLLLRFPPEFVGGGIQASRLMEQLACRDVEMTVLTSLPRDLPAPREERACGGRVIRFPVWRGGQVGDLLIGLQAAWWLLRTSSWDLLHVSGFSYFAVLPLLVAKLRRKPVIVKTTVLGANGAFNPGGSRISRLVLSVYRRADVIVALSRALEDYVRGLRGVRARVLRLPNGVDIDLFRPPGSAEREAARAAFGFSPGSTVAVTSGMLYPRKNVNALVRAAARARTRPLCIAMAGPRGPEPAYLRELDEEIAGLPPGVEVRLLGQLDPSRLAELLRAADVFVLVSRSEGLPNALLEGMAAGLACVATDIPGASDVLSAGGGRLVALDDEPGLAQVLDELASDPALRQRLGEEARKIVCERYSFGSVADRYRALYDELLSGKVSGCRSSVAVDTR